MTCFSCKGDAKPKLKTHAVTLDECVIIVKNVPSLVCTQCGAVYFTDETTEKLEAIVDQLESLIKEVAIVDYADNVA